MRRSCARRCSAPSKHRTGAGSGSISSSCTFIDSTGLRVIIEGARRAGEGAAKLGVLNLNEQPQRLFELTSVDRSELIEFA